ncbi:metalloregulator ArsR/SmtB family transcription factor [Microbacterium amylolyticum]|uniref:ArsR family transcriptional regulator n=1 Tax=Microbacterium amylolyticum TaxID=936337 RepID=A0ABS4ZH20_9MICO|nr:metalloregulator ArsR/SmtB family transcription factor [Microbacterium amylolyticum]MBP2436572.1 ArsR family transcriptional regulator [Microbacterium amylolyticum]
MDESRIVYAVADPTRSRILRLILESPDQRASVTPLANELGLRQPTVSHHLAALAEVGVVAGVKEGRRVWYSVVPALRDRVTALVGVETGERFDRDRAIDDLAVRFTGVHARETVAACLDESVALLTSAGHRERVGAKAAAFAASRLDAGAGRRDGIPELLFVCVGNAGRSQMAAAIARHLSGDRLRVRTAGSEPGTELSGAIVRVLGEIGVPVGGEFPKPLTDEVVRAADVVVTMGCGDACPVYPGKRYLDWDLGKIAALPEDGLRRVRDDVATRVRDLLGQMLAA